MGNGLKVGAVVQTRMGSTRLPGKVMMELCGKPVIRHVIDRLKQARHLDSIVIATTLEAQDDVIAAQARENGVGCFRGSESDVLSRYYYAAKENGLDIVVRITSDCPLIDPLIIDDLVKFYKSNAYDLVANISPDVVQRTFPRGLDAEVFSFKILEEAFNKASKEYQREHVTPYIYEYGSKIYCYKSEKNYSAYRWTLDTEDDLKLIKAVYQHLYKGVHDFYLKDVLALMEKHPELSSINAHVEQKKLTDK